MSKVMLIIRDGWGEGEDYEGNAIIKAKPKNHNRYLKEYPNTLLKVTGNEVGNPEGIQGGSEVGHLTMGAGRIVWQPYELINRAIADKSFFDSKVLVDTIARCKENGSDLHISGLFSDQGVHADRKHMYAVLDLCKMMDFDRVYIHLILDGRDMPERSAIPLLEELEKKMDQCGVGRIASVIGRYYGMDRDRNWDRTRKCYDLWTRGKGHNEKSAKDAIENAYKRGDKTDYYVQPAIIVEDDRPVALLKDKDSFIFYNFRSDRARQITAMITGLDYCPKEEYPGKLNINYACFCEYFKGDDTGLAVAFPQQTVVNNLGSVVSKAGKSQLRIAETEKYAHVTFFFNSQEDQPYEGEDRVLVHSPKVPSYDQKPEMSAYEVTDKLMDRIGKYDLIVLNFANPDLVGHSGVFDAVVKAIRVVDECVGKIVDKALKEDYAIILMGDHGNADHMLYDNGEVDPSHGMNPVRMTLISDDPSIKGCKLKEGRGLKDIAPTILELMGMDKPSEMSGESILER